MGLSRTVSEIAISVENRKIFPPPLQFAPPLKELPLELGTGAGGGSKIRVMRLTGRHISLTISSAVWVQSTNVTDRQTPGDSKDRAYA